MVCARQEECWSKKLKSTSIRSVSPSRKLTPTNFSKVLLLLSSDDVRCTNMGYGRGAKCQNAKLVSLASLDTFLPRS